MMTHVKVKVHPGSGKQKIREINDKEYEVWLKNKAEDNKANVELINLLSKEFEVDFSKIKIKNPKSRNKIVEIKNEI